MKPLPHESLKTIMASADAHEQTLRKEGMEADVFYLTSLCDEKLVTERILVPFLETTDIETFLGAVLSQGAQRTQASDLAGKISKGFVGLRITGEYYVLYAAESVVNQPRETKIETTVQGPQFAFTEDLETNLNMIRTRYPVPELMVENYRLGKTSQTEALLIYDTRFIDPEVLEEIRLRLDEVNADVVLSTDQILLQTNTKKYSLFPNLLVGTERPDRTVINLSRGKFVVMLRGTPFIMSGPVVFNDFMTAMDDLYFPFWFSRFMLAIRYMALLVTLTLPGLYISMVSYNPEFLRVSFALSVAGSRAAVPYPSFMEVLIMLFLIEALTEASIRLPRFIGATATTVGGLMLGQAAQEAGLVSSVMIIVTSAVAISNFVIPINPMSFSMRVVKYMMIVLASLFGIFGLTVGLNLLIIYLANMRSFGVPFFRINFRSFSVGSSKTRENR